MRSIIYLLKKSALVWIWPIILTTSYPTIPSGNDSATGDTALIKETQQSLPNPQPNNCKDADEKELKGPLNNSGSKYKEGDLSFIECMIKGITLPVLEWGIHYMYN